MTPALVIKGDDLSQLARLHAQSFVVPWTAEALTGLLETPGTFACALDGGFIVARAAADECEILTLAVRPDHRRKKLGTSLVRAAAEHAYRLGSNQLFLEVGASNVPARTMYERLGFTEVGRRTAYYAVAPGKFDDALILRSNLPLSPLGNRPASG